LCPKFFNLSFDVVWVNGVVHVLLDIISISSMLSGVPATTAWRVLGLRMKERPPAMEGSCEYIE
jgi:hypothetical protein